MGLGLYIKSEIPRKGLFKRRQKSSELLKDLSNVFKQMLPKELQETVFDAWEEDNGFSIQLHPSEEPVIFEIKDGSVICSAKTNSAGPGYHAFLVESLIETSKILDIPWQWGDESGDFGDETDYYSTRDFKKLQKEMLAWLHAITDIKNVDEEAENLMICLPIGFGIIGDSRIASPLGFWDRKWFEEAADYEVDQLADKGKEFFPWWEKGFGADFWYKCGLTTAWMNLPWRTFADEQERLNYEFVLKCFSKAKELDDSLRLPEKEIDEIRKCLRPSTESITPQTDGIGFKKRMMSRPLTGSWTVNLPGYYYSDLEDEGQTAVFWFGDRTVRGSSISMGGKKSGGPVTADELLSNKPGGSDIIEFSKNHLKGWAQIEKTRENGREYWYLSGDTATSNNLCHVTIYFDKDEDKDWAIETWKSVTMPEPGQK